MENKQPQTQTPQGNPFTRLLDMWKKLNRNLRIVIVVVLLAVIGVGIYFASTSSEVEYSILYTGMEAEESAEVYSILQEMGVDFHMEGTGTVMVPSDKRDEIKLQLLNQGYPKTGLDYSIFEKATGLGATDSDRQVYLQYQTEQNLAYMIRQMDKIKDATVMVTLAKTSTYALTNNSQPAQASVLLELEDGYTLTSAEAESIRASVVRAVAGLEPEYVTIADSSMHVYRYSGDASGIGDSVSDQVGMTKEMQTLIQEQVYNLLSPVFGPENVTVAANVVLNFDKQSMSSVTYSPPGDEENLGIIVSMRQTAARVNDGDAASGVPGFDSNGASPGYVTDVSQIDDSYYEYTQELNAEINEVREQVEKARGNITKLSVSVVIDADESWDEALESVRSLISNAVGVDASNISLMRTNFIVNDRLEQILAEQQESAQQQQEAAGEAVNFQYILIGLVLAAALVVVIILMAMGQKKRKRMYEEEIRRREAEWENQISELAALEEAETDPLLGAVGNLPDSSGASPALTELRNMAMKDPQGIAQLLRNWLSEDY